MDPNSGTRSYLTEVNSETMLPIWVGASKRTPSLWILKGRAAKAYAHDCCELDSVDGAPLTRGVTSLRKHVFSNHAMRDLSGNSMTACFQTV